MNGKEEEKGKGREEMGREVKDGKKGRKKNEGEKREG